MPSSRPSADTCASAHPSEGESTLTIRTVNAALLAYLQIQGRIPDDEAAILRQAAYHDYSCTCDTCREFWRLIGPDPDTNQYGPFGPTLDTQGEPT